MKRFVIALVVCGALAGGLVRDAAATAQQSPVVARIGILLSGPASPSLESGAARTAFRDGMAELGWVAGRNLVIETRAADSGPESLGPLAAELVRARVQVIVASNTSAVRAAKAATATIPIVGIGVLERIVSNLARPDANVTGVLTIPVESWGKQFEMLKEAAPRISRPGYLVEAAPGDREAAARAAAIGRALHLTVHTFGARTAGELDAALGGALDRRVDALVVVDTPFFNANRAKIVDFVGRHRLPSASMFSTFPESGFLVSYGTNIPQLFRRAAYYVDRLLKGARPADLPIEQPTKYDLIVNLKTAKTLGLTLPPALRLRADRVIE